MRPTLSLSSVFLLVLLPYQAMALSGLAEIQLENRLIIAHGAIMGLAFGMLFPLGATIMHAFKFKGFVWFHAGWQIFTYILALTGFGMGVWVAVVTDQLVVFNGHPIFGIIIIGMMFLHPLAGWLAHSMRQDKNSTMNMRRYHRWGGRILLLLGAINGGLGLQLAADTVKGEIAYGVITAFFFLLWFAVWLYDRSRTRRQEPEKESPGFDMSQSPN